ncbi:TolC family protein [Tritonibacter aquimaris]|nr:TolC family protein [Tritonibacter aquimaris]
MGGSPKTINPRFIGAVLVASCLTACSALEPVALPSAPEVLKAPEQFSTPAQDDGQITRGLLDLFDDPVLRATVIQAQSDNLDLKQSAKRLELAGIDLATTAADAWPRLSGAVNANRGSAAGESLAPTLDVQWEVDLWGRQADRRRVSFASRAAEVARHQALQDSIAGQLMQAWFDAVAAKQQQRLEARRVKLLRSSAENTRANYRAGIGTLDDLSAIERDVALSQAALALREGQTHDAVRRVELLLGQYPDNSLEIPARLPRLKSSPKPGLPLAVMVARPDMKAAWQEAVAANRRISVSQKDLLPQISLTGQFGSVSNDFSTLSHGATVWSLASSLTAPIFEAGRRRANIEASKRRADQALITYLQTALIAFSEVERALDQERILARREARLRAAVTHARATEATFETRYRAGLSTILDLLSARNAVFDIQSQLLEVRNARLKNRVALGLALGKGV